MIAMSRVFISYSHDTPAHSARVLQLAQTLRGNGIDVELDQFHSHQIVDWPRWCRENIAAADFVLCVCTAEYQRRIDQQVPPEQGKGVYWEGRLLENELYDAKGNRRFLPLLFDAEPADNIPPILRGYSYCTLGTFALHDAGYESLLRILTGQARVEKNPLGPIPKLAAHSANDAPPGVGTSYNPPRISTPRLRHGAAHLFGREAELQKLDEALRNPASRIMTVVAWGGTGKTSLAVEWLNRLAAQGWPGLRRVFDWSFYSQGSREASAASSDAFLAAALQFFGDAAMANSPASAWDKGARLATLIAQQPSLLVLDGLEPLQHPPGPLAGQLKDPALQALLKALARSNPGLCLVTTRESIADLAPYRETAAPELPLQSLPEDAGVALLQSLGVQGLDGEYRQLVRDVNGHALTLNLLGHYLAQAHNGDIRRRDRVKLDKADTEIQGGHAFKAMAAYDAWLKDGGESGRRQRALLCLLGLFDRPADAGCLAALRRPPVIEGLTDGLFHRQTRWFGLRKTDVPVDEDDWNLAVNALRGCGLLLGATNTGIFPLVLSHSTTLMTGSSKDKRNNPEAAPGVPPPVGEDRWGSAQTATAFLTHPLPTSPTGGGAKDAAAPNSDSLDAHPLIREYYAKQLRKHHPEAFRQGHQRLFRHLCETTPDKPQPTLAELQPLYQAVAHGCLAGLFEEARAKVYRDRILRGTSPGGNYSSFKLGAFASDLSAIAWLFEQPWRRPAAALPPAGQAWLLNEAAFGLRALGRLREALEPMEAGLEKRVEQKNWKNAAIIAGNLSELRLLLGDVAAARQAAQRALDYAERSGDAFLRMGMRTTLADAWQQAGQTGEAEALFRQAEAIQQERQPDYPLLYSVQGFRYCELLLAPAERAAWRAGVGLRLTPDPIYAAASEQKAILAACHAVSRRAGQTLQWAEQNNIDLLSIALDQLSLSRAALYAALLGENPAKALPSAQRRGDAAVHGLRQAGAQEFITRGLLSRAWLRAAQERWDEAKQDLDEAQDIAERGPMPLHLADVHLHRARLFSDKTELARAAALIAQHGYARRAEELADAQRWLA
jgi:hypothetical protein